MQEFPDDIIVTVDDDMAKKDISLRALIEYGAVLRKSMWGAIRMPEDYAQMQSNWEAFFKEHPDCDPVYHKGYTAFRKEMDSHI